MLDQELIHLEFETIWETLFRTKREHVSKNEEKWIGGVILAIFEMTGRVCLRALQMVEFFTGPMGITDGRILSGP